MGQTDEADRRAALKWADTRVREIREELEGWYRLFPELRGQARSVASAGVRPRRKRRPPTAASRRKISEGMRKLWAKRKADQAKPAKRAS